MGVTAMMLTLSVFYTIPRCDLKLFFLLPSSVRGCFNNDGNPHRVISDGDSASLASGDGTNNERMRLQPAASGPKYTQQVDDKGVR